MESKPTHPEYGKMTPKEKAVFLDENVCKPLIEHMDALMKEYDDILEKENDSSALRKAVDEKIIKKYRPIFKKITANFPKNDQQKEVAQAEKGIREYYKNLKGKMVDEANAVLGSIEKHNEYLSRHKGVLKEEEKSPSRYDDHIYKIRQACLVYRNEYSIIIEGKPRYVLNKEKYDKIRTGMNSDEVVNLLKMYPHFEKYAPSGKYVYLYWYVDEGIRDEGEIMHRHDSDETGDVCSSCKYIKLNCKIVDEEYIVDSKETHGI